MIIPSLVLPVRFLFFHVLDEAVARWRWPDRTLPNRLLTTQTTGCPIEWIVWTPKWSRFWTLFPIVFSVGSIRSRFVADGFWPFTFFVPSWERILSKTLCLDFLGFTHSDRWIRWYLNTTKPFLLLDTASSWINIVASHKSQVITRAVYKTEALSEDDENPDKWGINWTYSKTRLVLVHWRASRAAQWPMTTNRFDRPMPRRLRGKPKKARRLSP